MVWGDAGVYGIPVNGYPSWRERTILTLTNAARMTPSEYRTSASYSVPFTPSLNTTGVMQSYAAQPPLFYNVDLSRAARQHSQEMADLNYFSHNSADGGSPFARIGSYYTLSGTMGENIAAGTHGDPIRTMHQWLCDVSGGVCCQDGQSCDGHRRGIMNGNFKALGTGYGYNASSTYDHYWTQDFGGVATPPFLALVDGSHVLPTAQIRFIATVSASAAAQSVSVVVDGVPYAMAVDLGTATRGTWFVVLSRGTACRSYHFVAVDASGTSWRYPAAGQFRTRNEGSCTEEYVP